MPSGKTHDKITIYSTPAIAVCSYIVTNSVLSAALASGSFLFSGMMFGPDLDIYSRQYLRWGWLRYLWLPYQKAVKHRSMISHGPIIGTVLRAVYLGAWLTVLVIAVLIIQKAFRTQTQIVSWYLFDWLRRSATSNENQWLAVFTGLELGAASHYLADWSVSYWKKSAKSSKR